MLLRFPCVASEANRKKDRSGGCDIPRPANWSQLVLFSQAGQTVKQPTALPNRAWAGVVSMPSWLSRIRRGQVVFINHHDYYPLTRVWQEGFLKPPCKGNFKPPPVVPSDDSSEPIGDIPLIISAPYLTVAYKDSGRFAGDEDFLQFRTAPKMMMDRKRNWAENETVLKTEKPKTKLGRN